MPNLTLVTESIDVMQYVVDYLPIVEDYRYRVYHHFAIDDQLMGDNISPKIY